MKIRQYDENTKNLFSWYMVGLIVFGIVFNFGIRQLVLLFKIPLYLDNIGSVIVGALGGPLPGMITGFISNMMGYTGEPSVLYFGILTIFIALTSAIFSRYGLFKRWWGFVLAAICFAIIGGVAGSVIGWLLYGGRVDETFLKPFVLFFVKKGFAPFWAQFTSDIIVNVADKTITTVVLFLFLRFYPKKLHDFFPFSYLYDRSDAEIQKEYENQHSRYKKYSIYSRIVRLASIAMIVLSVLTTTTGGIYFYRSQKEQYIQNCMSAARVAESVIDGDKIDEYLEKGPSVKGYAEIKELLTKIRDNCTNIEYLYVYQIHPDGCHVVFDLDTPTVKADECGAVIDFDEDFRPYFEDLFVGKEIPPVISNGEYGWLVTAYSPVKDSAGQTKAYVGADNSAVELIKSILTYLIQLIAVQFAIYVIVICCTIRYAQRKISDPITALVQQSLAFDKTEPSKWLTSEAWRNRKISSTQDEIQTLSETISGIEANVSRSMIQLLESAELERKNRELAEAVKKADALNEAKTEFYSRMSHDMRTPMNGILGLVELSKEEKEASVLHTNIHKIGEAGNYLLGLINDTLDISKLESKKLSLNVTPIYAKEFITSLADMITPSLKEKDITYEVINHGVRLDIWFSSDKLRLQQIFANLVSNAIKFTPRGGMVTLTLDNRSESDEETHDRFILRDSGIGMSKDFMEHGLFRPFSQEHNELTSQYAGSGLGLAIVKNLIELMHGSISVESELGEGTTFTIDLDFKKVPPNEVAKMIHSAQEKIPEAHFNGKRILLAEDNELNAEIAMSLLGHMGLVVERVENGQLAVARFVDQSKQPFDLILMDIRMPIMDGITAAKIIRSGDSNYAKTVPIIAMTANAYQEDREQTKAAGMDAHIAKPIDTKILKEVLARYLA